MLTVKLNITTKAKEKEINKHELSQVWHLSDKFPTSDQIGIIPTLGDTSRKKSQRLA